MADQTGKFLPSAAPKPEPAVKALPPERPPCGAMTRRGTPCQSFAMVGDGYCWTHSPAISADVKLAAYTRGGLNSTRVTRMLSSTPDPSLQTPAEVTRYLENLAGRIERCEIPSRVGSSLVSLAGAALKAHEMNIAQRLAELEELVASRAKPVMYGARVIPAGGAS